MVEEGEGVRGGVMDISSFRHRFTFVPMMVTFI